MELSKKAPMRTCMGKRDDGNWTADAEEIDELLHRAWDPVSRMYSSTPGPDRKVFDRQFGGSIAYHHMAAEGLSGKRLMKT